MEPSEFLEQATDVLTAKRVIGEPYEKNGVTVIPAVSVGGGGGGGLGNDGEGKPGGYGGGFGVRARPLGADVIKGDSVRWVPSIDATRVAVGAQLTVIVALLVLRSIVRSRTQRTKFELLRQHGLRRRSGPSS